MSRRLTAGNDAPFVWVVKVQGQPFDLSGKDVKVYVINSRGEIPVASLNIEGNRVSGVFEGRYQTRLGGHSLILRINEGRPEMMTASVSNVFDLVQWSADAGGYDEGDVIIAPVVISSELRIGSGEGGGSYDDTAIWEALNDKVDKEEGKGLSTNDYTDAEREKLAGLENYDDTELKEELAETYATKEYVDEAVGNAGGGGEGCECATPDWSAPEGKEGHILNRTHYKDAITSPIGKFSYKIEWDGQNLIRVPFVDGGYIDAHIDTDVLMDYTPDPGLEGTYIGSVAFDDDYDAYLDLYGGDGDAYDIEIRASDKYDGAIDIDSLAFISFSIKTLDEEFIPDTIARTSELTELSAEVGNKQDTISDLENIREGAKKGATALQSVPDTYATKQYVDNAIKEIPQGGGEPSQYIKDATTSADGNTLTLTKKDNTQVVFSPSGGGTGGGVTKEHYYDVCIDDGVYRVNDACANDRYIVVGTLKAISLYDRQTGAQVISSLTSNIQRVALTSEGIYVTRNNILEVRDFDLNILHSVDLGHSDLDKCTFTDNECYAVIGGVLNRIDSKTGPVVVEGYENNVIFVKHAYNVGTSILKLNADDSKYYLSLLENAKYNVPTSNQALVFVGDMSHTTFPITTINTLGIISNQLYLSRLYNGGFGDVKIAMSPMNHTSILNCSVIEGNIYSVAVARNFTYNNVALMNNSIYAMNNPHLISRTLCTNIGQIEGVAQVGKFLTRIKVIDL